VAQLFAAGRAGERFAVPVTSGAISVVEGTVITPVEYMTGGTCIVITVHHAISPD